MLHLPAFLSWSGGGRATPLSKALNQVGRAIAALPAAELSRPVPPTARPWDTIAKVRIDAPGRLGALVALHAVVGGHGSVALLLSDCGTEQDQYEIAADGSATEILLVIEPVPDGAIEVICRAGGRAGGGRLDVRSASLWEIAPERLRLDLLWEVPRPKAEANWPRHYGTPLATQGVAKLRDASWRALQEPVTLPWIDGVVLSLGTRASSFRAIAQSGLYEPGTTLALEAVLPMGEHRALWNAGFSVAGALRPGSGGRVEPTGARPV